MSISIGAGLSSLAKSMQGPRGSQPGAGSSASRILQQAEIEERQKAQQLALANKGKKKSSDMDTFFLQFTEYRNTAIRGSVIKMAEVMDGSTDEHILTTNGDPALDELKRQARKYEATPGAESEAAPDSADYQPMTAEQIQKLIDGYELKNPIGNNYSDMPEFERLVAALQEKGLFAKEPAQPQAALSEEQAEAMRQSFNPYQAIPYADGPAHMKQKRAVLNALVEGGVLTAKEAVLTYFEDFGSNIATWQQNKDGSWRAGRLQIGVLTPVPQGQSEFIAGGGQYSMMQWLDGIVKVEAYDADYDDKALAHAKVYGLLMQVYGPPEAHQTHQALYNQYFKQ